jgi:Ca2+:H+ antiporter
MIGAVIAPVHHEVIANRIGEPYGTLVLSIAVTIIEFAVASLTRVAGRTHLLQGVVHLVIFGACIFFALVP